MHRSVPIRWGLAVAALGLVGCWGPARSHPLLAPVAPLVPQAATFSGVLEEPPQTPAFGASALFPPLPPGDLRLEPLPQGPLELADTLAWFRGTSVKLRFFPRPSVGEGRSLNRHADIFIFVRASDGALIDQPFLLEAVPKGAAGPDVPIPDEVARAFSTRWEVHVLRMADSYDPADPAQVIDSTTKLFSPLIVEDIETNLFLNCPVLPPGAVIPADPGVIHAALWNGHAVRIATYEVDDAPQAAIPLYVFQLPDGTFSGRPVVVRIPGEPNYSSLWDVRAVQVPFGYGTNSLRSHEAVVRSGLRIVSLGFQVNCPVTEVTVDDRPVKVVHEKVESVVLGPDGRFSEALFPRDVRGAPFSADRVVRIISRGISTDDPNHNFVMTATVSGDFLLRQPTLPPIFELQRLIHDAQGNLAHLRQEDLDQGRLTAPIDSNVRAFLPDGVPFASKVALVGRALFEHEFTKEEGSGPVLNRMSCAACHGQVATGGGGPAMFSVQQDPAPNTFGPLEPARILRRTPHVFGSGLKDELARERRADGVAAGATPFKRKGSVASLRDFTVGALEGELGLESIESIAAKDHVSIEEARALDPDGDGVVAEMTVGDVTALVTFQASLPAPTQLPPLGMALEGESVRGDLMTLGEQVFRADVGPRGAACASCHTPFVPLRATTLAITNPLTSGTLSLPLVPSAAANGTGQLGLAAYSDFAHHKMGPFVSDAADQDGLTRDTFMTRELWGLGSSAPYLHDGSAGGDVGLAIAAHRGALLVGARVSVVASTFTVLDAVQGPAALSVALPRGASEATLVVRIPEALRPKLPLRLVVTRVATGGVKVANAESVGGGAVFTIAALDAQGEARVTARFTGPTEEGVALDLAVADDGGFSEALPSAEAWQHLAPEDRAAVIRFLRSLRIGEDMADDRGYEVESP